MLKISNTKIWKMAFPQYNIPDDADPNDLAQMQQIQDKYQQPVEPQQDPQNNKPNKIQNTSNVDQEVIQLFSRINSLLPSVKVKYNSFYNRTHSLSIDLLSIKPFQNSTNRITGQPLEKDRFPGNVYPDFEINVLLKMFPTFDGQILKNEADLPPELEYLKKQNVVQTSGKTYPLRHTAKIDENKTVKIDGYFEIAFSNDDLEVRLRELGRKGGLADRLKYDPEIDDRDRCLVIGWPENVMM